VPEVRQAITEMNNQHHRHIIRGMGYAIKRSSEMTPIEAVEKIKTDKYKGPGGKLLLYSKDPNDVKLSTLRASGAF